MLYPLSYSRAARQCSKGMGRGRRSDAVRGRCEDTHSHSFQACEDTLYRSGSSILSAVRRRQW